MYYLGSAKTAADYEVTTRFLMNWIRKNYEYGEDIASSLEDGAMVDASKWEPTLKRSSNPGDSKTKEQVMTENKQSEMIFKEELTRYFKQKEILSTNTVKVYAFLWEQCSKSMQMKIESRKDFKSTIEKEPIELLKAIREHALNYQNNKYEMTVILDALRTLVTLKQREDEGLQDYTRRFKTCRDVLESHIGGPLELTKVVKAENGYDKTKHEEFVKRIFERFITYVYIDNADKNKYGSLLTGLATQHSLGNNQYPIEIVEATNVLSNHRFDKKSNAMKQDPSKKDKKEENNGQEPLVMSFAQMEGKCYCCGKAGHKSPECRFKDKAKEEWAINKAKREQSHNQSGPPSQINEQQQTSARESQAGSLITTTENKATQGWAGVHITMYQSMNMKDWILLDNQSTVSIFCNEQLVHDIHKVKETMDLSTNAGTLTVRHKATVPGFGLVWFDNRAITNIFSFAEMEDRHRITYEDHEGKKAFVVHLAESQARFRRSENGLYYFKPKYNTREINMVETIEENKRMFTPRQVKRAKTAQALYYAIGTPSLKDFKMIVQSNSIRNNPVTVKDINLAEQIFGPDIGSLKGKSTRQRPTPIVNDYIEIPSELISQHEDVQLCIDTMFINGLPFLTTISRQIMYRTACRLQQQSMDHYWSALKDVFRVYNAAGFRITKIHADNEFRALREDLKNLENIEIKLANAQEHVPEAERNIRVMKERVRATFHRLPFTKITKIMTQVLVMECAKQLNFFPPKDSVSTQYSPRMIIHHEPLDYERHCATPFGTYVQALDDSMIKNDLRPRTIDCIYLRPSPLHQTGYELLDLRTNRVINRGSFTVVPITQNIIELVHSLSERDNMPTGLKIATRTGHTIYDSTWIAGVDYENNENNNDQEIDDDDEDYIYEEDEDDTDNFDELEPEEIYELANSQEKESEQDDSSEEDDPIAAVTNDDEDPNNVEADDKDDNNIITEVEVVNKREDTTIQQHQAEIAGGRRSTRVTRPPVRLDYKEQNHFISQTCADMEEYT
ncbi:hypothetical protein ACA910_007188 [Epithemia clementina (nom. ined.)]